MDTSEAKGEVRERRLRSCWTILFRPILRAVWSVRLRTVWLPLGKSTAQRNDTYPYSRRPDRLRRISGDTARFDG